MTLPSALKAKMIAGSALVLLFGSGIVVGLAWDQTASATPPSEARERGQSERDGGRRRLIVENVGLSVEQKAGVDSLVTFHRQRMHDLDKEFQPRYRALIADLREEIKQVLTEDQRVQYDVLLTEHDATRARRRRDDSRK